MRSVLTAATILFLVGACAKSGEGKPTTPAPGVGGPAAGAATFVIVPMQLVAGDGGEVILELRADGSVGEPGEEPLLRFTPGRIEAPDGRVLAELAPNGTLTGGETKGEGRFDERGELAMTIDGETTRVWVEDDGRVVFTRPEGTVPAPVVFVGFKPEARRTAAVIALFGAPGPAAPVPAVQPPAPQPPAP